jgi:hypothetical protein
LDGASLNNFNREINDLVKFADPMSYAEFVPTRNHGRCWTRRITKSFRLAYRVSPIERIIELITTGDHKKIYGKDKHS